MTVSTRKRLPSIRLIMDKIHAPVLVGCFGNRYRPAMQAHALAATHPHVYLQAFEAVDSMHAFVVHEPALPSEHDLDTQVTEPWARVGDVTNAHAQRGLIFGLAALVPSRTLQQGQPTRSFHSLKRLVADLTLDQYLRSHLTRVACSKRHE